MFRRVHEADQADYDARRKAKKRMIVVAVSLVFLVAIVVTVIVVTKNTRKVEPDVSPQASTSSKSVATTLKTICNFTLYPSECYETLSPLINSTKDLDPATIFRLSIQVAINEIELASTRFDNINIGNATENKIFIKALKDCKELMVLALQRLNATVGDSGDLSSALTVENLKTWLSSVITYQQTCVDGFQNATVDLQSVVSHSVNNSTKMASNSLALLTAVAKFLDGIHLKRRRLMSVGEGDMPSWAVPRFRKLLQWQGGNFGWNGDGNPWNGGNGGGNPWNGGNGGGNPWNGGNSGGNPWNGGNGGGNPWNGGSGGGNPWNRWNPTYGAGGPPGDGVGTPGSGSPGGDGGTPSGANGTPNVVVAADGTGDYKTITEAMTAAPDKSTTVFVIYVKEGTYYENVLIDKTKWNISMVGDGMYKSIVSGSLNFIDGTPTYSTATFAVLGQGFMARDMGFENTAGAIKHQAVAMMSDSDMSIFYKCSFMAYQDTLYAHSGRQFYKECDVYGTVDFIFGNAAAVLQSCNILLRQPMLGQSDTITAQGRIDPNQNTGLSIHQSKIWTKDNLTSVPVYLGRPWKNHSTTVFMSSYLEDFINPEGWLAWNASETPPNTIFYGEYKNNGPGSSIAGRVTWSGVWSEMSDESANMFTVTNLLNGDDWIPESGLTYTSGLE